jgi:hypothetical protein
MVLVIIAVSALLGIAVFAVLLTAAVWPTKVIVNVGFAVKYATV